LRSRPPQIDDLEVTMPGSQPADEAAAEQAPHDAAEEHRTNAERVVPSDGPEHLSEEADRIERHSEQAPDATGISPPRPHRPPSDAQRGDGADPSGRGQDEPG
jgi:hypothetical protein